MGQCHTCGRTLASEVTVCPVCGTSIAEDGVGAGRREDRRHPTTDAPDREPGERSADGGAGADPGSDPAAGTASSPSSGSAADGSLAGRFWLNSVLGGALGFLLATVIAVEFPPAYFLGLMGGAFVGGLVHKRGAGSGGLVGAMAGFLATIPFVAFLIVVVGVGAGVATIAAASEVAALLQDESVLVVAGIVGLLVVGLVVVANIVAGALGGLLGGAVGGA